MPLFIDLSIPIEHKLPSDPPSTIPEIEYITHEEGAAQMISLFPGFKKGQLHDSKGWTTENLKISTNSGTHLDSPYHYHPTTNNCSQCKDPGRMTRESTLFLLDQGLKITGIDAWSWNRPFCYIQEEFKQTNDPILLYVVKNTAGIEKEYYHIEKTANFSSIYRTPILFYNMLLPYKNKKCEYCLGEIGSYFELKKVIIYDLFNNRQC